MGAFRLKSSNVSYQRLITNLSLVFHPCNSWHRKPVIAVGRRQASKEDLWTAKSSMD